MKKPIINITIAAAAVLALSACELRREGGAEPEPTPEPTATSGGGVEVQPSPTPQASESAVVSIIRDEPAAEEIAPPVAPLQVTVPFGNGGNNIGEEAESILLSVLQSDALREGWPVILRGHTDSSGNDSANLRASRSRAEVVAAWLVERGVDDERIEVIAFGEQNPLAPNAKPDGSADEEGRALNRRVDIEIASQSGSAVEEMAQTDEDA